MKASVKVMRSHDYCHFEVQLSTDEDLDLDGVNELRKRAALLVDEAVRQYQLAKKAESRRSSKEWQLESALSRKLALEAKAGELTAEEAAFLRGMADADFWREYHEDDYCYEDQPERDHHFSMLRRFKDELGVRVRPGGGDAR